MWIVLAILAVAIILALYKIITGPRLVSKLLVRYLLKRRIAWVSLIAVMLCTAMVLIVISVMGGWLRMFREMNHGLIGDVIVSRISLDGFSGYEQMIDEIKKLPEVAQSTPVVRSYALADIGSNTTTHIRNPYEVIGFDLKTIGQVNGFVNGLHLQPSVLNAQAADDEKTAASKKASATTRMAEAASSADPESRFEAQQLQGEADDLAARAVALRAKAASFPSWDKPLPASIYDDEYPNARGKRPDQWGGIIVGEGVLGKRHDDPREDFLYNARVKLDFLKVKAGAESGDVQNSTTAQNYWLSDDSHTGVFQVDQNTVYLPFDELQKELDMQPHTETLDSGEQSHVPGRCNQILISLKPGSDLYAAKADIAAIVDRVLQANNLFYDATDSVKTQTWDERQHDFLDAVEHEKGLLVILFGIISVVAVFLIFCIFFMIVMEKTRDIGIIKSVGATGATIAGIFLGYGLTIGLLGGGMGLFLAYLVVHNINELHTWLGAHFGIVMWNPKTYLFDRIPSTMDSKDVIVIVSIAILSSVIGALVPAIRAARMNPIECLRWE